MIINEKTLSMKNHARKKQEVKLRLRNLAMLSSYFDYIFVHLGPKARLRPKIFVNFRPEPDPKSPARFTTLGQTFFFLTKKVNVFFGVDRDWKLYCSFKVVN